MPEPDTTAERIQIYNAIQTAIAGAPAVPAISALLDALGAAVAAGSPSLEVAQGLGVNIAEQLQRSIANNFMIARDRGLGQPPGNA